LMVAASSVFTVSGSFGATGRAGGIIVRVIVARMGEGATWAMSG
jgi:hypothetical protein